ncbi:MAG: transcription-repair coupling factor [Bacilli bacterium]|nr:transcription-repair coupling factor [Bacilli bacterium]
MDFLDNYFKYENGINVFGLTDELNVFYMLNIFKKEDRSLLVVANSLYEANKIYRALKTHVDDTMLFLMDDFLTSVAVAVSPDLKINRLEVLEELEKSNRKRIVVTNLMGYLRFLPSIEHRKNTKLEFKLDNDINRDRVIELLEEFGYRRESLVTNTGEYAVRGYVIDIFGLNEEHPVRIELFGNTIDSIRYFDENTQLTTEKINYINILPVTEVKTSDNNSLFDYMKNPWVVWYDKEQIDSTYNSLQNEILNYCVKNELDTTTKFMFDINEILVNNEIGICKFDNGGKLLRYNSKEIVNYKQNFDLLKNDVNSYIKNGKKVIFCLSNEKEVKKIRNEIGLNVSFVMKRINKGFILDNYVVIGEYDIENIKRESNNYKNTLKIGRKIKDFDQLQINDYVVHKEHGIGVYKGIVTLNAGGFNKDYIQINYLGNDKVYVPVEKITTIFKYSSKDGVEPKINKLNSTAWAKTKRSVEKRIKDISGELIELYAARSRIHKEPYKNYEEEELFAHEFDYVETDDQLKAINDINEDLQKDIPMDRLLCGDVGFGKTEVAFRGMFKTILNNKQVMYLCPTTILSKQQYESAKERFRSYPIEIALLNRFTSTKEAKEILLGLENGTIDLVFGTHRLLSEDVKPKRLGMLVVDEEQRFGVTHKEKIKSMKKDVNVLTLSATPIPRTLKMAMSGLRELSIIDTAPTNRYPVQTYVIAEDDVLICDAIYKELSRNGQVFALYNRIETIENMAGKIKRLVPEARIVYAHGRMTKYELEKIMSDFIEHKYDVLLCTTIIETGIDIPNANTLIIFDADRFGLSQLYQIRGRVGRSDKIAYAYLLYNKEKMLNDIAVKRLKAISDFTELGSGYKIAMRDLAIRGAGDILGSSQAGFVDSIGINMYMQMIEDEIKRQKGEKVLSDDESDKSIINVSTHISDDYVSDEDLKIEIHQKINEIDSVEKLKEVKKELEDRFGKINDDIEVYMYEELLEKLALKLNIKDTIQTKEQITFSIPEELSNTLEVDKFMLKLYNIEPSINLRYVSKQINVIINLKKIKKHYVYIMIDIFNLLLDKSFYR